MADEKIISRQERYRRGISCAARQALERLMENQEAGGEAEYFWGILRDTFVNLKRTEDTYIGTYCAMVPEELIYGFGLRPLRLCSGSGAAAVLGEQAVPRDACPVVKACIGCHAMGAIPIYEQCRLAILPDACDVKKAAARTLSGYLPVVEFAVPGEKSEENFERTVEELRGLSNSISAYTGKKLSNRRLVQACRRIRRAQEEAYRLYTLLAGPNPPISGTQVIALMNSFCYDRPESWAEHMGALIRELAGKAPAAEEGRAKPRIFLAGAPVIFPNLKLPFLLEEAGARIVGDETCMAGRLLYDPVVPDDLSTQGILRALAARSISACTCPVFDQSEDRIYSVAEKLRLTKAEGIIYHVLRGCTPYDYEFHALERLAGRCQIPILRVETDYSGEDAEQLRIRLEAFCEMIEERRRTG